MTSIRTTSARVIRMRGRSSAGGAGDICHIAGDSQFATCEVALPKSLAPLSLPRHRILDA